MVPIYYHGWCFIAVNYSDCNDYLYAQQQGRVINFFVQNDMLVIVSFFLALIALILYITNSTIQRVRLKRTVERHKIMFTAETKEQQKQINEQFERLEQLKALNDKHHLILLKENKALSDAHKYNIATSDSIVYRELSKLYDTLYSINHDKITPKLREFVYDALRISKHTCVYGIAQCFEVLNGRQINNNELIISEFNAAASDLIYCARKKVSENFGTCIAKSISSSFNTTLSSAIATINDKTANKKSDRLIKDFKKLLESIFKEAVNCRHLERAKKHEVIEAKKALGDFDKLIIDGKLTEAAIVLLSEITDRNTAIALISDATHLEIQIQQGALTSRDEINSEKAKLRQRLLNAKNS